MPLPVYIIIMNLLKKTTFLSAVFVMIIGTLSHFIYEWSGENVIISYFAPVNESIWEHLKLLFFPVLFFSFLEMLLYDGTMACLIFVNRMKGIYLSLFFIVAAYYTYSGILGFHMAPVDIAIYYVAVFLCYFFSYFRVGHTSCKNLFFWISLNILFIILFF